MVTKSKAQLLKDSDKILKAGYKIKWSAKKGTWIKGTKKN